MKVKALDLTQIQPVCDEKEARRIFHEIIQHYRPNRAFEKALGKTIFAHVPKSHEEMQRAGTFLLYKHDGYVIESVGYDHIEAVYRDTEPFATADSLIQYRASLIEAINEVNGAATYPQMAVNDVVRGGMSCLSDLLTRTLVHILINDTGGRANGGSC
jgi:hypothetical protein